MDIYVAALLHPRNISRSPSPSKSKGTTQEPLLAVSGSLLLKNFPFHHLDITGPGTFLNPHSNSLPPLTTYRSRSPSLSASKKTVPMSSYALSASNAAIFCLTNFPFLLKYKLPACLWRLLHKNPLRHLHLHRQLL